MKGTRKLVAASWSGWKNPGVEARASQFVGTGAATAYWNCRG